MSTIDSPQYDAAIEERDKALRECERLTRRLEECRREINYLQKELGSTWQQLATAKNCAAEVTAETELLRRAWELFGHLWSIKPDEVYRQAAEWMAHRDQQRKAGKT